MKLNRQKIGQQVGRYVPIVGWIKTYQRAGLRDDLVSGVVVGAVMIPVAMAYAQMAGVPPQAGLYSAIVGMTIYAILATSRHLKITTSSTMSIMSIAVVAPLAASDPAAFMALSSALALTVGIIMLVLGIAKLGFISDFLAKSVMTGYIFGVACLIAISQLPKIFGVPGVSGTFFQQVAQFISELPETNVYSLALGVGTIVLILVLKRFKPLIPGALVALVLGIVVSSLLQLNAKYGVSVVGVIPTGMAPFTIPIISLSAIPSLIVGAVGIVFLAVGETLGTGRAFAAKYHYEVDADQELLAMGAANVGSGLFQGITIDMSLSSTASGEAAGERTQLSSLVSAGVILAVVVFLAPLLRNLPTAVLGAIVLSSILGLFNFAEFRRYYRPAQDRFCPGGHRVGGRSVDECHDWPGDCGPAVCGDAVVSRQPAVHRDPGQTCERRIRRYRPAHGRTARPRPGDPAPGCAVVLLQRQRGAHADPARRSTDTPPRAILLDLGASADLDIGTSDMLRDLNSDLRQANIDLLFAQVRGSVRRRMRLTGLFDHIGEDHIFLSVAAAASNFEQRDQEEQLTPSISDTPAP